MAVADLLGLGRILGLTVVAAFATEYACWFLGARQPAIRELDAQLQKKKREYAAEYEAQRRKTKKNLEILKIKYAQIKDDTQKLSMALLKSQMSSAVVMMLVFPLVMKFYKGVSIGTLPFAPVWYFKSFMQQGLENPGPRDMSATFWYFLCVGASRGIVKLFFPQIAPPSVMDLDDPALLA